jgi:tetratricopeptide (TPR) repeat protein
MGRFPEAKDQLDQARELEPLSLIVNAVVGRVSYYARQYDAAIDQYRKTLEIDPDFHVARRFLGQAYAQQGKYEEALAQFQRFPSPEGPHPLIGYVYARMGMQPEAEKVLDDLSVVSGQQYVPPFHVALIYASLGKKDAALNWLEKAVDDRSFAVGLLKVEPMVDNLRDDPRFQKIIADMKFPP